MHRNLNSNLVKIFAIVLQEHWRTKFSKNRGRQQASSVKEPDSKYLKLCGLYSLCQNFTTLPLQYKSSHKQYVNKRAWLNSNRNLFHNTSNGPDIAHCLWLTELWPRIQTSWFSMDTTTYPCAGKGDFTFMEEYKRLKFNRGKFFCTL